MSSIKCQSKVNFYIKVLYSLRNNIPLKKLRSKYSLSRQRLHFYLKNLKKGGFIELIGKTWQLTNKGINGKEVNKFIKSRKSKSFSLGTIVRPTTNLHALQIKIPILSGKIDDRDWQIKERLNNWIPKYKTLANLGGLTIKNNNNKSITIFAHSRNITNLDQVDKLSLKIILFIWKFFEEQNVKLDIFEAQTKNIHLETEDKQIESVKRKGDHFILDLNKKAEKILPKDNINAKAWIEGSPFLNTVGTNDKEWKRAYLQMPFSMKHLIFSLDQKLTPSINKLSYNLNTHISVLKGIETAFNRFNTKIDTLRKPPKKPKKSEFKGKNDKDLRKWL